MDSLPAAVGQAGLRLLEFAILHHYMLQSGSGVPVSSQRLSPPLSATHAKPAGACRGP